jgi:hypothetical protein
MIARSEPRVFTLKVGETPVLTFQAVSCSEALSLPREEWLRNDLRDARSQGAAVWDGKQKLSVRQSTAEEVQRFTEAIRSAVNGSDDLVLVFLIDLDQ